MGTWLGHAAPGTFFICVSIWYTIRNMLEYYTKQGRYRNALHRKCCCACNKVNVEGIVIIILAIMGVVAEVITGEKDENFPMSNSQHVTMYVTFGMFGVVDVLRFHKFKFLPPGSEYLSLVLALIVELVLFAFHLHGRPPVDIHVHILLVSCIAMCALAVLAELHFWTSITANMARNFSFMLQGSWFFQMSFILYPPWKDVNNPSTFYDLEDMENIMITTLIFSWHAIGCLMVTLILSGLVFWCCSPRCQGDYTQISGAKKPLLNSSSNSPHSEDEETLFINKPSTSQVHHQDDV